LRKKKTVSHILKIEPPIFGVPPERFHCITAGGCDRKKLTACLYKPKTLQPVHHLLSILIVYANVFSRDKDDFSMIVVIAH